ncbi:hypothetical protein PV05_09904 [Exophiala xenobiotica]|uniref:Uncharacterized protein n=1 Tax=Exophiala xenobiotica TaxID=348802 RepID=A0A0D2BG16_9EURO|nr:uncharacterized protein PV05_09904 [Exophiala xenobiotica]KIW51156.1 hypothetical protein PV05_09904 [Exophiala xenobiotica]
MAVTDQTTSSRSYSLFLDAGPLENDPVSTVVSEARMLYPSLRTDLIVSLGTGIVLDANSKRDTHNIKPYKAPFRIQDLV